MNFKWKLIILISLMYNLPKELKLIILSNIQFDKSKILYNEFKCTIPIPVIKHWFKYVLSELISDNTKFGFGCNSSYNLSPELLKFLNLPMYTQLKYESIIIRVHSYIKTNNLNNGENITCDTKLSKLLNIDQCTFFTIRFFLRNKNHFFESNIINFNTTDKCYKTKKFKY
jgi:hypothetical protein